MAGSTNFAFENLNTLACSVTAASDYWLLPVRNSTLDPKGYETLVVQNIGTKTAYLAWGTSISATAAVPTAAGHGATAGDFAIPAGAIRSLAFKSAYIAMICAGSDSTTVLVTPGYGAET